MAVTLRYFFWQYPEWWSIAISAFAWAVMLQHSWQHGGHEIHHVMPFTQELLSWMLMIAAMMLPLVIYSIRMTALGSLWARRHRAITGFLLGYFSLWLLLGFAAATIREVPWIRTNAAPAFCFLAAALWQKTRMHKRALIACHGTRPLAPVGWQADRDCFLFGGFIGVACIQSCWPLMLGCTFAGHGLVAMAGGTFVGILERRSFRSRSYAPLVATLITASWYLVLAILDYR